MPPKEKMVKKSEVLDLILAEFNRIIDEGNELMIFKNKDNEYHLPQAINNKNLKEQYEMLVKLLSKIEKLEEK